MKLEEKDCKPCFGNLPELPQQKVGEFLKHLPGWEIRQRKLVKRFHFGRAKVNYPQINDGLRFAKKFVDDVFNLGEEENHSATIRFGWGLEGDYDYGFVEVEWFTVHRYEDDILPIFETDFILAARTEIAYGEV